MPVFKTIYGLRPIFWCKQWVLWQQMDPFTWILLSVPSTMIIEFSLSKVSKRAQTCHPLHQRPGCYYSTSKKHVRDRIFKLTPIHAPATYPIPRGVFVLLICVQILVRLDCFSRSITMEVWKPARWKTTKIHRNEHSSEFGAFTKLQFNLRKTLM